MADQGVDGFDNSGYRDEVQARWGTRAWADSDRWWQGLDAVGRRAFMDEHSGLQREWADLRASGSPVAGPAAQALARRHHAWIARAWGGTSPDADQLAGLAEMYVADERFAGNYGGTEGASYVRDALVHLALTELA